MAIRTLFFSLDFVWNGAILGHSFTHRLKKFLATNYSVGFLRNFNLSNDLWIRWHGTGGRTISQTIQSDLGVVASFAPDVVILQLGTNDLTFLSAVEVGSALEDLTRLLFESYGVRHICVCQTLYRKGVPSFNKQVNILSQYLRVVFEPIPYAIFWRHRGFWKCTTRFQKLLTALSRQRPADVRLPVTRPVLHKLIQSLSFTNSSAFQRSLFSAMYLVAFYGLFRIGELAIKSTRLASSVVQFSDLTFLSREATRIWLKLPFQYTNTTPTTALLTFYWLQKNLSLTARLQLLFNIVRFAVIAPALFSVMLIIPPFLCISSTVSSSGV